MSDTSGRELYSNDEGTPVLKQSFVLYLDELGTSVSLSKFTDDDLRQALAVYDNLRDFLHDEAEEEFQRALYFSDNLVVVAPHLPVLGVDQGSVSICDTKRVVSVQYGASWASSARWHS